MNKGFPYHFSLEMAGSPRLDLVNRHPCFGDAHSVIVGLDVPLDHPYGQLFGQGTQGFFQ